MKLILEITGHADDGVALHRVVEIFPATLGRGYHNDIIIDDPHVGERHLSIDYDGAGWVITDLGSVNPTLLNAKPLCGSAARLASGDALRLGVTTLRVFSVHHPVAPPVRLQRASPVFLWLTRPRNVWLFFFIAAAAVTARAYAAVWSENKGLTLAGAAAGAIATVFVWAALWSVAGRLIRRKSYFMGHVAIISLYLILGAALATLSAGVAFLSSENWFSVGFDYTVNALALALLLYGGLSLATLMKKRKRMAAALFFAAGIALGIFGVGLISAEKFDSDPPYPYHLSPLLAPLAPAGTVDSFMKDSEKLFASDVFERKKDAR
jgi:hypothetical protein